MARGSGLGSLIGWGAVALAGYYAYKSGWLAKLGGGTTALAPVPSPANNWGGLPAGVDQTSWSQFNQVIDAGVSTPWATNPGQFAGMRVAAFAWWNGHGGRWPTMTDLG